MSFLTTIQFTEVLAVFFLVLGLFFAIASMIGMVRLPDFYSRVHASGNSETLATMLIFLGLAIYNGFNVTSFKILLICLFIMLGNPIGSHILAKSAYKTSHPMYTNEDEASHPTPIADDAVFTETEVDK